MYHIVPFRQVDEVMVEVENSIFQNKQWFETLFLSNQTSMATKTIRPLTSGAAAQVLAKLMMDNAN